VRGNRGLHESHLSYIQEGLCYLLTGTTPIVRARVCVCRCGPGGKVILYTAYTYTCIYIYIYIYNMMMMMILLHAAARDGHYINGGCGSGERTYM
jgi:hypothetical protein